MSAGIADLAAVTGSSIKCLLCTWSSGSVQQMKCDLNLQFSKQLWTQVQPRQLRQVILSGINQAFAYRPTTSGKGKAKKKRFFFSKKLHNLMFEVLRSCLPQRPLKNLDLDLHFLYPQSKQLKNWKHARVHVERTWDGYSQFDIWRPWLLPCTTCLQVVSCFGIDPVTDVSTLHTWEYLHAVLLINGCAKAVSIRWFPHINKFYFVSEKWKLEKTHRLKHPRHTHYGLKVAPCTTRVPFAVSFCVCVCVCALRQSCEAWFPHLLLLSNSSA